MHTEVQESILDIQADHWNSLIGNRYPFLSHEFLAAAEETGCVCPETGWTARHIVARNQDGRLLGALPLYEKTHSWGEFVFDWSWAQAYQQAGYEYYPKLVSATPFTPAPSPRLLMAEYDAELAGTLIEAALDYAKRSACSSLHFQFPTDEEIEPMRAAGLMIRKDCQFHWHNNNYENFDQFLATFSAAKRKKAKRDRRHVAEEGIQFRWMDGHQLDDETWRKVYELISITFMRRGSLPYFSFDFFKEVSRRLPDSILVVLAERGSNPVGTAVFYRGANTLYGRYWGCNEEVNALHFETCYYQGIGYCIANGIRKFEPGTQGEHKISRGFSPVPTWSAHWLEHPQFFAAIERYVDEEKKHIDHYIEAVDSHSPYKKPSVK